MDDDDEPLFRENREAEMAATRAAAVWTTVMATAPSAAAAAEMLVTCLYAP